MTEESKQELRQLLKEATAPKNLKIRPCSGNRSQLPSVDVNKYRTYLREHWTSYSESSLWILRNFDPQIANEDTKSKLLDFIRVEFAQFIHEDRILSASHFLLGGFSDGFPLDTLLDQLLKIAIAHGIEGAVLTFDRGTEDRQGSFQYMALLEGIRIKTEIQVFEGIRLVPLPNSTSELPYYLPNVSHDIPEDFFFGKTMLIVDCSISPIFHKPFLASTMEEYEKREKRTFRVKINSKDFPYLKVDDFPLNLLCQGLSLACHSEVKVSFVTKFLPKNVLYNLSSGFGPGISWSTDQFKNATDAEQSQIDEAKRLYSILTNLKSKTLKNLRIPIDRWIKSKTSANSVDRMIDLGIAFEALYLSDISETTELSFRLRLRASWFLGKGKAHQRELMKDFSQIYEWRSKVVHTGKLPNKTKRTPFTQKEIREFIEKAQDLCRQSIIKILEDGEFPDWNDLILGEVDN